MAELSTRDQRSMAERLSYGVIAAVIAVALVIQLVLIFTGGADANSGETGQSFGIRLWRLFSFFTIQSNLIVLAVAGVLLLRPSYDGHFWRTLRLGSLLRNAILVLVIGVVLAAVLKLLDAKLPVPRQRGLRAGR
jgi:hypothetical protein